MFAVDPALRRIVATASGEFRPYDRYGEPVPGMSWVPLSGEIGNGLFECFLLRMAPGCESRPHEHVGYEEFLLLEGEMIDGDGQRLRSGDFVSYAPGSRHSSSTPQGCLLLVMLRGGNNRALDAQEIARG